MLTPEQVDYLLDEWARWSREDVIRCGWPKSTSFGKAIKPDPSPSRVPIDELRAYETDICIAHLHKRMQFIIRLHYLGNEPLESKARRLRCTLYAYKRRLRALQIVVGTRLIFVTGSAKSSYPATVPDEVRAG